jgi:phosphatidylserine decarboxylase
MPYKNKTKGGTFVRRALSFMFLALLVSASPVSVRAADLSIGGGSKLSVRSTGDVELRVLPKENYQPITIELINLLKSSRELKAWMSQSLAKAAAINPDKTTNPAQNLISYINYVDQASRLIPQEILDKPSDLIRDQILQSIAYFYFLIDQPIDGMDPTGKYKNTMQYEPRFSVWARHFADAWGDFLDTPESFTDATYKQFMNDPNFRLKTGDYEPRSNWNTFNRFFSRYLSSPSVRPIAELMADDVVVSPADSVPQGVWQIDASSNIVVDQVAKPGINVVDQVVKPGLNVVGQVAKPGIDVFGQVAKPGINVDDQVANPGIQVKNLRYYNVDDLLGPELAQYHGAFANGVLTHTFLNVFDYHRYHFSVGGEIMAKSSIQQNVALEVSWNPTTGRYDPIDSTGWQFTQTRGIVIVKTERFGLVALIPMGMAHVSSVNFESNVVPGNKVKKGDMLGTFLFGGSDFIILFQKQANFVIQAPTTTSGQPSYQHIFMGARYGQMLGKGSLDVMPK